MKLFKVLSFSGIIFVLVISSCSKEKGELPGSTPSCDTTSVSYSDTIQAIMNRCCAYSGCHVSGGSGNGDFSTYTGVQLKVSNGSFNNRVFVTKDMTPPGVTPVLTACEKNLIKAWLNAGAPNN